MREHFLIPVIPFEKHVMERGRGSYLYDKEGKQYLDLNSGQFCAVLGHSNSTVLDWIFQKGRELVHTASNIISQEAFACSKNLHRISGDMRAYSITLSTGAEAVEFALRFAKYIKGRDGVICFDKGYHGLTLGAQSVTFSGRFSRPLVTCVDAIATPDGDREDMVTEQLEILLKTGKHACVLMEPIVSVGGMLYPTSGFFQQVRELCDRYDVLLLFDESQTGCGRTGQWFAYQTLDVVPDIVVLSKGVGLGFPVSAVLFRDQLMPKSGAYGMTHYSSHQNDAFSAAVVNAGIAYIEQEGILNRVSRGGNYFLERLRELECRSMHLRDARGCGLMLGAELFYEGVDDYRSVYHELYDRMMDKGVIIQGTNGGHTLRFLPDYLIVKKDIDLAVGKLEEALGEVGDRL